VLPLVCSYACICLVHCGCSAEPCAGIDAPSTVTDIFSWQSSHQTPHVIVRVSGYNFRQQQQRICSSVQARDCFWIARSSWFVNRRSSCL
jgi:hypothetical protein